MAKQFSVDQKVLLDIVYKDSNDAESRLRTMFKYAASKGVTGTPTYFVNSAMIQEPPYKADAWMSLLNDTYNSQYPKKSGAEL